MNLTNSLVLNFIGSPSPATIKRVVNMFLCFHKFLTSIAENSNFQLKLI